jgi:hypothetical protein
LLLLGCLYAAATGAFEFARTRVEIKREKMRQEQLKSVGADTEGLGDLKLRLYGSAALAIAGAFGLFLFMIKSGAKPKYDNNIKPV